MGVEAVACLVCGKELENVWPDATNQPANGVACYTSGNYGSRSFDSLDGEVLEFNVCDECLVEAGKKGRIYTGRPKRPVILDGWGLVGWQGQEKGYAKWNADWEGFSPDDVLWLNEADLYAELPENISLNFTISQLRKMMDGES